MAIWEYKVISSGKGGFANPKLLENFLNELGAEEWEIIDYRPAPDNPLAFSGLARRSTQRDWTLEAEAAAQAREEERCKREEERRREEERIAQAAAETEAEREVAKAEKDLRTLRDTERDDDPEAFADEASGLDNWDEFDLEDELPTLLDALKPHLRRNPKGLGEAAAIDYLAKRWEQDPADVVGALEECGFVVPESEEDDPAYFDFEGDLFWLNRNNRGQLFINVREKPRPRFKTTKMKQVKADDPATEDLRTEHEAEKERRQQKAEAKAAREAAAAAEAAKPAEPLPEGLALLDLLKGKMRRNRRGPGFSGSINFLTKALKHGEDVLTEALAAVGLVPAADADSKPSFVEHAGELYWLKQDARGGLWINCKEADKKKAKTSKKAAKTEEPSTDEAAAEESGEPAPVPSANAVPALRLLLKPKSRGTGVAATIEALAEELGKAAGDILDVLTQAGLSVPETAKDKPAFIELGDEILWINRNARTDTLWLNAKVKPKRKAAAKKTVVKKAPVKKTTTKKAATAKKVAKKATPKTVKKKAE
jgi:hypothetical protein